MIKIHKCTTFIPIYVILYFSEFQILYKLPILNQKLFKVINDVWILVYKYFLW